MAENQTIYCGSGKIINTKIGEMTKLSFSKDDINKMVAYMKENNLNWLNCNFAKKKNVVDGKPTHYVSIDTWKPEAKSTVSNEPIQAQNNEPVETDDLPF